MNSTKTLPSKSDHAPQPAPTFDTAASPAAAADLTPTATRPLSPTPYRPRSWRYPMGLFQALLPLDDRPAASVDLRLGGTAYGPRYGNRLAWARRFPGFGSTTDPADPACRACNA